ncbi:RHOMBOID-like protein 1 isoform X2 [Macadamia integrifolia]|uniref:RHOMBOID-like protein 1 isoform X2 n=1 Tax=Macadamia integrifolia TaxID=60698 RepID=UPI001C52FEF7|nr:RHOMBOID-like protein 1 isoform X2 [Macadamia integrifolia]
MENGLPSGVGRRDPSLDIETRSLCYQRQRDNVLPPVGEKVSAFSLLWLRKFHPLRRWFPWLIPTFVVVNVALFVITMYLNNCPKNSDSCLAPFLGRLSFQPFKYNPLLGPSSYTLKKMGAQKLGAQEMVHGHQAWHLITCIWLHAGVFHVLANMSGLLFIGIPLEQGFGFGLLYVLSGFGGSLLSALFTQSRGISLGASGAIFGLVGGMLSELITNWTLYENKFAALFYLLFVIVVNLAVGLLPQVDNFGHLGGLSSGFLLGFVFLIRPQFAWVSHRRTAPKHLMYQYILWILALILLILGFTIGLVMFFRGVDGNDLCSWCHYLSCVPISRWSCKTEALYCWYSQNGNQLILTCQGNRTNSYPLANASESQIRSLCYQLCS